MTIVTVSHPTRLMPVRFTAQRRVVFPTVLYHSYRNRLQAHHYDAGSEDVALAFAAWISMNWPEMTVSVGGEP